MKNILLLVVIFSFFLFPVFGQHPTSNQQPTEIQIHYFNNYPFSFKNKAGQIEGIEVDILNAFVKWMKTEKSIELKVQYQNFNEFSVFYKSIIAAPPNVVGLGSVSITTNRQKEVSFTPPYLKNKSILVSQLEIPTLRSFNDFEINLSEKTALVIKGTSHENELLEIKEQYYPQMRVKYVDSPRAQLQQIFENKTYFGYVDLLSYWTFLQERCCVLKIHRAVSTNSEYFGFVLPHESAFQNYFLEFFEGGFGFTSTEEYRKILEKYLGYEVISSVELY